MKNFVCFVTMTTIEFEKLENKRDQLSARVLCVLLGYPFPSILQPGKQGREVRLIFVYL